MAKKMASRVVRQVPSMDVSPSLPPGLNLLRTFECHAHAVNALAFHPYLGWLASGGDSTIELWDLKSGKLLLTLEEGARTIYSVAFDPRTGVLASGGNDSTVKLWNAATGKLIRTLEGRIDSVNSLAFDSRTDRLASGGVNSNVRIWDSKSGKLVRVFEPQDRTVFSVAFDERTGQLASASDDSTLDLWDSENGKLTLSLNVGAHRAYGVAFDPRTGRLASGSGDATVRLWDSESGKLIRTLEGHTDVVDVVAFSADGRLLASKSNDNTVRIWSCDTWMTVAVIPAMKASNDHWLPGITFHPTLPQLAIACVAPAADDTDPLSLVHLLEFNVDRLLAHVTSSSSGSLESSLNQERTVHHATAKIVLVGDSGVGKTGLGWRLAHGEYREHDSTHGQQFWVLNQLASTRLDGTECEAVLWDLAGQPDYRLIHALSIQDADLALILFDPTNNRDPLGSAEYWLRQLPPSCPKMLVAARVDRGHPVLTQEELTAFCQRQSIAGGWIATSASSGLGLDELLTRMKQAIPWDDKPAVSTDAIFKQIKDFVLRLKERRTRKQIIFTSLQLRDAIEKQAQRRPKVASRQSSGSMTDAQLLTAVRHLSSQGFVRMLTLSTGEERILLVPELMNNLAASMVLEARRNPRGLGAVEESRLFDNSYRFQELENLSESDQGLLLDGTIEAFLANRLSYRCFREAMGEIKLLVFPDLMNLKKPQRDDLVTEDGPSYILDGLTENTFAGLVVLLGYTNLFLRTDQAHDVAWFESNDHEICGVRQIRDDNERTLVLLFSHEATTNIRQIFEGLVEQMLSIREGHVRRVRPVRCSKCETPVDRAVIARRLKQGKSTAYCEDCGELVVLPPDEPVNVKPAQLTVITHERAVAELRTTFEEVIYEIQRLAQAEKCKAPCCFVSYAWGNSDHERWVERRLALDLEKAGVTVILDRWDNAHPGESISRFVDRIEKADHVLVVGTTNYRRKFENKDETTGTVVAAEMDQISNRLLGTESVKSTVIPLLLEGDPQGSLPPALHNRVRCDFRNDTRYFETALDLLLKLYRIPARHPAVAYWKQRLSR
jgi:WD40 repeat protein